MVSYHKPIYLDSPVEELEKFAAEIEATLRLVEAELTRREKLRTAGRTIRPVQPVEGLKA